MPTIINPKLISWASGQADLVELRHKTPKLRL